MSGWSQAWDCYGYHIYVRTCLCINAQVANLCIANDDHTSPESQMAKKDSGGVGGGQQDTKVALFGLVNLFEVRE